MTRIPAPVSLPVGLTIAGSDSGGGAGIQADLKTMEAHDVFGTSVLTAVTAQNTTGVTSSHVLPLAEIDAQFDAVLEDFEVRSAKTGMLATAPVIELVTERLASVAFPVVVDPVMVAATGDRLLDADAEDAYGTLIAHSTLVTPNADEAAVLTGLEVTSVAEARSAAEKLVEMGANAALVKGGHVPGEIVTDVVADGEAVRTIEHERVDTDATHGSGCTLASSIAARLARGDALEVAVDDALSYMERVIRYPIDVGTGPGSVHHLAALRNDASRDRTADMLRSIVTRFVELDVSRLVPEVGMNVVGATRFAESVDEIVAVDGRITRTLSGAQPSRDVRFGASSHVARFLLATRDIDPRCTVAVNCRFDAVVEEALRSLDGPIAEYDRATEPDAVKEHEGSTMNWGARRAFEQVERTPVAVVDRGEVGKEAVVKLLATDADAIVERMETLLSAVHRLETSDM